jgi:hypothetical protein
MTEPRQPPTNGPLDTPEKLQAYLDSCPPGLTKLNLAGQKIPSLAKVRFPSHLLELNFYNSQIKHLQGVIFPPRLKILELTHNYIESLEGVQFPSELEKLSIILNQISSLKGVQFPPGLIELNLGQNKILSLEGVKFPPSLKILKVDANLTLTSLVGVQFPPELVELDLSRNSNITSLEGVQFPSTLMRLSMHGTGLKSLTGIISPNKYVKQHLKQQFLHLYLRDLHPEMSALKTARQSQKATLKEMSDLSQQSMQTQMRAVTSFLREGMQLRANQHAEQLLRDRQERPTKYEESLFYATLNKKRYPIPMNEEMTIQEVLNYLNDNYYISVLYNCGDMHINKPGDGNLDSRHTLKYCQVVSDDVLDIVCGSQKGGFVRSRKLKPISKHKSRSNCKSKKNGHKHKRK